MLSLVTVLERVIESVTVSSSSCNRWHRDFEQSRCHVGTVTLNSHGVTVMPVSRHDSLAAASESFELEQQPENVSNET